MSFTDGKRFVVTAEDIQRPWGGGKNGEFFRCHLCGSRFVEGDGCRWQYSVDHSFETRRGGRQGVMNFMVCDNCDGPDVLERWVERNREFYSDKFWSLRNKGTRP